MVLRVRADAQKLSHAFLYIYRPHRIGRIDGENADCQHSDRNSDGKRDRAWMLHATTGAGMAGSAH